MANKKRIEHDTSTIKAEARLGIFPFFRLGESEPTFCDVEQRASLGSDTAFRTAWTRFPESVERTVVSVRPQGTTEKFESYKRIAVGNDWCIFFAYVEAGAELDARAWFRAKMKQET